MCFSRGVILAKSAHAQSRNKERSEVGSASDSVNVDGGKDIE